MKRKSLASVALSVFFVAIWLMSIPAVSVGGTSGTMEWESPSSDLTFGSASLFSLFVFGDFEQEGADCEGGIAVGGNATFPSTMDIGMPYTHTEPQVGYLLVDRTPRFIVNGTLSTTLNPIQIYGGSTAIRSLGEICKIRGYRFDGLYGQWNTYTSMYTFAENTNGNVFAGIDNTTFFSNAETALNTLSMDYYNKAPESGRVADDGIDQGWQFDIGFDESQTYCEINDVFYYYVTLPDFCSTLNVRIPDGKKVVVNVLNDTTGSPLFIGPGSILINDRSGCEDGGDFFSFALTNSNRITWNFIHATNIHFYSIGFIGSVLAPQAVVKANGGGVCGQMIVKHLNSGRGFEVHNAEVPKHGLLRLTKTDVFGNGLANARFGIFEAETDAQGGLEQVALMVLTSGSDGRCESTALLPADYFVRETSAPEGYRVDPTVYPVHVVAGRSVKVNAGIPFVNRLDGGQGIALSKVCEGGSADDDFTFLVTTNGQLYSGSYRLATSVQTTTNGQIVLKGGETAMITGLDVGDEYLVTEVSDSRYVSFSENAAGVIISDKLASIVFRNVFKKQITVRKQAAEGVTGAYQFSLYDDAACTHVLASSNAVAGGAAVVLAHVTNGVYYVQEAAASQARFVSFVADDQTVWTSNPACIVIDERITNTLALSVFNSTQLTDIVVQKSDANRVQGTFMFSLYADPELRTWIASIYPTAGGDAVKLATVTNGTYYLYEVLPDRQYRIVSFSDGITTGTENGFPIVVDGSRKTVAVTVVNTLAPPETEVFLRKSTANDIHGNYFFTLYATPQLDKWAAEAWVTAGGETVRLGSLTNGTYYLYEFPNTDRPTRLAGLEPGVFAPFGQYSAYRVDVTNSPGTLTLSAVNEPMTSIYVQKSAENDVSGAFQILLYADPACATWVADCWVTAGQDPVRLSTVTNGTYYIYEKLRGLNNTPIGDGGCYDFVEFRGATPSTAYTNSARITIGGGQTNVMITVVNKPKTPLTDIFVQKIPSWGVAGSFMFELYADAALTEKIAERLIAVGPYPVKIASVTNGLYYLHERLTAESPYDFDYAFTVQATNTVNNIPITVSNTNLYWPDSVYVSVVNMLKSEPPTNSLRNRLMVRKNTDNGVTGTFTFGLYADNQATQVIALAEAEAGGNSVLFPSIVDGTYYVREVFPTNSLYVFGSMTLTNSVGGAQVVSSTNGLSFSVTGGSTVTVNVANAPKPLLTTPIQLRKSAANTVSGDFHFGLYQDESCTVAITSVIAVAGSDWIPLATVTNGTYYLKEVLDPAGAYTFTAFTNDAASWSVNPAKIVVNNGVSGQELNITAVNSRKPPAQHAIYVQKSSVNEMSGGFEFALYGDASCSLQSRIGEPAVATAGGSSVLIGTVTNGTYYVREEYAQEANYWFVSFNAGRGAVATNPITFTVSGYEDTTVTLLAINAPKPLPKQIVSIHKSAANGVTGSFTFALYQDADCRKLAAPPVTVQAGASSETELASVTNGIYYLREELPEDSLYQFVSFNNSEGIVNVNPMPVTVAGQAVQYEAVNIGKALGRIEVKKHWSGSTSNSVTFHLYRSATKPAEANPSGTYVRSVTLSGTNDWSAVFTRLELDYYYYVKEEYLDGYIPVYTSPVFLAAPTYPLEGQTNSSGWVDAAPGRTFGFASDFHVFVFEDFTPKHVGVEGGLAAGGNIALDSANSIGLPGMTSQKSYSPQLPIAPHDPRVLCGGTFSSSAMLFIYGGELWTSTYSGRVDNSVTFRIPKALLPDGTYSGADSKFVNAKFEDYFSSGINSSSLFADAVIAMKSLSTRYASAQTTSAAGGVLVVAVNAQPVGSHSFEVRPPAGIGLAPYGTIIYNVTLGTNALANLKDPNIIIPDDWSGNVIINILPSDNVTQMTFNTVKGQGYTFINGWRTSTGEDNGAQKKEQYDWAARYAGRILWNFPKPNLRVIYLNEFALTGSILAPYAHLEVYAGEVNGQIVARALGDTGYDGSTYVGPADNANGNSASLWEAHLIRNGVYVSPEVLPLPPVSGSLSVTNISGVSTPPALLLQTTSGPSSGLGMGLGWTPTPGRQYKIQIVEHLGDDWQTLDPTRYVILYRANMMEAQIWFDPAVSQSFYRVVELQEQVLKTAPASAPSAHSMFILNSRETQ
jgi:choice-of-anchor A domain-containing protein